MDAGPLISAPVNLLAGSGSTPATAAELAKRGNIQKTAQNFESSFLSSMLQTMFQGVSSSEPPFGGGAGEDMWKSFLAEAMAKQMTKTGGIGVSKAVAHEMLKMQGLTEATP
jgi:Rod binding domain-containing protein